jgi:hypothetical protein
MTRAAANAAGHGQRAEVVKLLKGSEMKLIAGSLVALLMLASVTVGEEKPKMMMSKDAMMAKKKMMEPAMMKDAEMSMMGEKTMLPAMVAKEMVHQEVMHDKTVTGMMEKPEMMMDDKKMQMASDAMLADPQAMQMLFQELVARHIAAKKMSMMMQADPKMESMAGKEMKKMMMDKEATMMAKKKMTAEESMKMMAHESMVDSLMHDEEIMSMVEKQAKMQMDPKMAPMMADDKVKMAGEKLMKDKDQMEKMVQHSMTRQSMQSQKKMMAPGKSK